MSVLQRVCGLSMLVTSLALAGCGGVPPTESTGSGSQALTLPYSATDLGAGTVQFSITLPSGQHYVEVFSRKNGVQNVAHNITSSALLNGDGTTTYTFQKSGYVTGDIIEYRFYSYVGPGVFTPGPSESTWVSFRYGGPATFQTSSGSYVLGLQKDASGRTFSYQVETTTDRSYITPYSTGWFTTKASPAADSVPVQFVEAELVGTFVKKAGSTSYDPVTAYDTYTISPMLNGAWLDIAVDPDTAVYPGVFVDSRYAEGGHTITLQTFIGPQTLLTDATVTFAYLIKQKTWAGALAPVR